MPIYTPTSVNNFSPASLVSRAKAETDWTGASQQRSGIDGMFANYDAKRVATIRDFLDRNGRSNPDFQFNKYQRAIGGIQDATITRGYIRRSDTSDDVGGATLNFMFNPEQITRDYVSYLDQAALDPFNTLYQSGNLVNPPSFVNFNFSLFFDRQDDMAAKPRNSRGVLVDYQYFDLVVRNVVPAQRGPAEIPDNGIMMVNPTDITVVFSKDLTVQGRPINAKVTFSKFDHRMVPIRMQIDLTMIITYFGPLRSPFGLSSLPAIKKYDALVPYSDTMKDVYSEQDVQSAVGFYQSGVAKRQAESGAGSANQSWFSRFTSSLFGSGSGADAGAVTQTGGAANMSSGQNLNLRSGAAGAALTIGTGSGYSGVQTPQYQQCAQSVLALATPSVSGRYYSSSGLIWEAYAELGAGRLLANTDEPPTVAQVVQHQEQTGWATMPIVAYGGARTDFVRKQATLNLQNGDILIRKSGGRGHMAIFSEWNRDEDDNITGAKLIESRVQVGAGVFDVDLDYICDFNYMTRPLLSASQSLARGVL